MMFSIGKYLVENGEDCFLLLFPVLILIHHKQQALDDICWYASVGYNFLSFHLVWYSFLKVFAALNGAMDYHVWSRKKALQGSIGPHCGREVWWILAKALWPVAASAQRSSEVNDDWQEPAWACRPWIEAEIMQAKFQLARRWMWQFKKGPPKCERTGWVLLLKSCLKFCPIY